MRITAAIRGREGEQCLEPQGVQTNAITTVAKDNILIELHEKNMLLPNDRWRS
jgi:hypothetical protein